MADARERLAPARRRWVVPVLAAVVVVVLAIGAVVVLGGDDDGADEADGSPTSETVPPSSAELELVDVDLADPTAPAAALEAGELTVAMAPATLRAPGDLVALADDRDALVAEPIVPLVSLDVALPELDPLLQPLAGALTTEQLVTMAAVAAAPGAVREDVVSGWLQTAGLEEVAPIEAPGRMRIQTLPDADLGLAALAYGDLLLAAGFEVEHLPPAPTAAVLVGAVRDRTADMVLAGGSSLLVALGRGAADLPPADEVRGAVAEEAGQVSGTALTSVAADRRLTPLTAPVTADDLGLASLSDLSAATGRLRLGVPPGCDEDPLCRAVLEQGYGLRFAG